LIDASAFAAPLVSHLGLVVDIVGGLIFSKSLAALLARRAFGSTRCQGLLLRSLSLPQVAAMLADALVAFEARDAEGRRLIDEPVIINSAIVLMVLTSVLGPILTEQFGKGLKATLNIATPAANASAGAAAERGGLFR
jgi:hypothetical protein